MKIRIRIDDKNAAKDWHNPKFYLTIYDGVPRLSSKDGTPMSLSYLTLDSQALRFKLEDAESPMDALDALRGVIHKDMTASVV